MEVPKDEAREQRITWEITVDAYDEEERGMGWYYYLEGRLRFPFQARCVAVRRISPLQVGEVVQALRMAPEEDNECEMLVEVEWAGRTFGVPLSQLEAVGADAETQEAIEDWHYWVARGYEF